MRKPRQVEPPFPLPFKAKRGRSFIQGLLPAALLSCDAGGLADFLAERPRHQPRAVQAVKMLSSQQQRSAGFGEKHRLAGNMTGLVIQALRLTC